MKAVVTRVAAATPVSLEEIDISNDTELEGKYGLEIPVLLVEGRKVAKFRINEEELRRVLASRARAEEFPPPYLP